MFRWKDVAGMCCTSSYAALHEASKAIMLDTAWKEWCLPTCLATHCIHTQVAMRTGLLHMCWCIAVSRQ